MGWGKGIIWNARGGFFFRFWVTRATKFNEGALGEGFRTQRESGKEFLREYETMGGDDWEGLTLSNWATSRPITRPCPEKSLASKTSKMRGGESCFTTPRLTPSW